MTRSSQRRRRSHPTAPAAAAGAEHEQPLLGRNKEQRMRSDESCEYCRGKDTASTATNTYCTCGGSPQEKTRSRTIHTENAPHASPNTSSFGTYFGQRRHKRRKHRIHRYFTLRYHVNLIVEYAPRLLSLLFHGTPRWLFKLVRLLAFVMALLPGFVVFAYYYFWSADRIALPYREDGVVGDASNDGDDPSRNSPRTSRHFVDVYGSRTALTMRNDGRDISYDRQYSSMLTTCNDMSSGENGGNGDEESKPVVIFLTGGAWIIGYKMWGALLARVLVPLGVLVVIPDYRNFPQTDIGGMVEDVDEAIQWTLRNCKTYGGDPKRVVVIGQSAGAHLGSCVLLRKALEELDEATNDASPLSNHHQHLHSSYKARAVRGFMAASGPYNITAMQDKKDANMDFARPFCLSARRPHFLPHAHHGPPLFNARVESSQSSQLDPRSPAGWRDLPARRSKASRRVCSSANQQASSTILAEQLSGLSACLHEFCSVRSICCNSTMGVEIEVIKAGDGATYPKKGDMLTMHYTGTLASDGTQFDSSVAKGRPFQFVIGISQVIMGWDEGVMKMSLGEKSMLKISSDYGYGAAGAGGVIPPNADLNFEVELLAIGDTKAPGFTGSSSGGGCVIC